MIIFFTVALTIYASANVYILLKGYNSISVFQNNRAWYFIVFLVFASAFVIGKILETRNSTVLSDILSIIGGFWLAFMLYGFMFLILSDILSIVLRLTGILNKANIADFRKWAFIITLFTSIVLIITGFINALNPVITNYDLKINKSAGGIKELRVAAVSDIHLGSIIRKRSIRGLSEMLRELEPDLVILLGDIVDGEMGPVLRDDLLDYFTCPKCRDGLYAITGNHEFIGGAQKTIPYIESKGIRLLKDEVVTIEGGIQLIGRLDRDSKRFFGRERKSLDDLLAAADTTRPMILLDHQPLNLDEAENSGIDLQLSGHTHNGQMWPLNHLVSRIYELNYGYMQKGRTSYIVSSGFGIWGPRVRLGSRPEVLLIKLRFNE